MKNFSCAIIGAGISGLAAARELQRAGESVVVLEKSRAVGGRLASRRAQVNGQIVVFDHGAQNIKSRGRALEEIAREVLRPEERIWIDAPVCLHDDAQVLIADAHSNAEPKWSCVGGITLLAKALARDLDVRFQTRIASIQENAEGFLLRDENGEEIGARHIIISAPANQSADLLRASELLQPCDTRIAQLRGAEYNSCLSIMLFFDAPFTHDWYALLARDRTHPLLWLASENHKQPQLRGTALVAQLGPAWSAAHYDDSDEGILAATLKFIAPFVGEKYAVPNWSAVKRWRYSQPRDGVAFDDINSPQTRILVCGDATAKGRVTDAFDTGIAAARRVLEQ